MYRGSRSLVAESVVVDVAARGAVVALVEAVKVVVVVVVVS